MYAEQSKQIKSTWEFHSMDDIGETLESCLITIMKCGDSQDLKTVNFKEECLIINKLKMNI